jgi:Acetyltransferase (GNAT) domain
VSQRLEIQTIDRPQYDLAATDFSLPPFLEPAWVEALAGPQRRPAYFAFRSGSRLVGLAAGLAISSPWPILSSVSKHFYLYGLPPMAPGHTRAVMDAFTAYLRQHGFNTIQIADYYNPPPPTVAELGLRVRLTEEYRLDLTPPLADLHRCLNRLRRRLINRAIQSSLLYEESQSVSKLDDLLGCLTQTRQRRTERGVGGYSYYYIPGLDDIAIARLLESGIARICTVSQQGRLLSAGLVVRNRRYAYYILAGATKEGYDLGASTYMQWCVIEQSKTASCSSLNLGGIPKDQSSAQLIEFKRSFGTEPHPCESGSVYLLGEWRKFLHRCYKFASNPTGYLGRPGRARDHQEPTSRTWASFVFGGGRDGGA